MAARPEFDIDDAVLDRARELRDAGERFDIADADRIVGQIQRDAAAAGMSPGAYVWSIAESSDVTSPHHGALLWSGRAPSDRSLSNRYIAAAWAERHDAVDPTHPVTTIESTPGGSRLDGLRLYGLNDDQLRAIGIGDRERDDLWERMSERYADRATGQVRVFSTDAYPEAVLYKTELPELRTNPEVGANRVGFTYEPPEKLSDGTVVPDNVRAVLNEPGNQACFQLYDPLKPGYLDPKNAGAMPPDALRVEEARLRAEVEASDRARSASAAGGGAPTPTAPTPAATPATPTPTTPDRHDSSTSEAREPASPAQTEPAQTEPAQTEPAQTEPAELPSPREAPEDAPNRSEVEAADAGPALLEPSTSECDESHRSGTRQAIDQARTAHGDHPVPSPRTAETEHTADREAS